jgi:lysophospholipase L1-like esterase
LEAAGKPWADLAEGFADDAAATLAGLTGVGEKVDAISRTSPNLLDPTASGWETDKRINAATGVSGTLSGWDSTPLIPVSAGTYVTNIEGYFAFYNGAGVFQQNISSAPAFQAPVLLVPGDGFVRGSAQRVGGYQRSQLFFQPGTAWPTAPIQPFGTLIDDARLADATAVGFADDAIGPDKLSMWQDSANLANPIGRVDGQFMNTNGAPSANASFSYWPRFRVSAGQVWTANQSIRFVTFLDAGGRANSALGLTSPVTQFTVPTGAVWAIVSTTAASVGTFAISLGATVPTWSPFAWRPRSSLPNGQPVQWGVPPGADLVSALDGQLGGADWRGSSAIPDEFGLARLRETRQRLRALRSGGSGASAQLNIGAIGDSFTHDSGRYINKLAQSLWAKYHAGNPNVTVGPIGPGWISFNGGGSGSFANGTVYWNSIVSGGGGWSTANGTGNGPDSGRESSSTAGAWLQLFWSRFSEAMTFRLVAEGGSGVIRYRWSDAGAWTQVDLSALAAGVQVIALSGPPSSGSGTIRFEVVSGSVSLYGLDVRLTASAGILVHKLGATGTSLQQWAALDATRFQAGIAALGLNLAIIMHGTNDQTAGRTKAQFKSNLITKIDRLKAARPSIDILLAAPPENQRTTNPIAMSEYAAAMYEVARDDRDVAFIGCQVAFGSVPAEYAAGSSRPWWSTDLVHPDNATGGTALQGRLLYGLGEQSA